MEEECDALQLSLQFPTIASRFGLHSSDAQMQLHFGDDET